MGLIIIALMWSFYINMCIGHAKILMFLRRKNPTVKTVTIYTVTITSLTVQYTKKPRFSFENLNSSRK
jgi:hypothetical protein